MLQRTSIYFIIHSFKELHFIVKSKSNNVYVCFETGLPGIALLTSISVTRMDGFGHEYRYACEHPIFRKYIICDIFLTF